MQQMRDRRDADPGATLTRASLDTLQTVSLLGQAPSARGEDQFQSGHDLWPSDKPTVKAGDLALQ